MSEENEADQVLIGELDNPDGILRRKKKNKNKVIPATDTVTSVDEKNMALKKVLELEKELLDMKSMKNESDDEVKGLKYELKGLQNSFKDLQQTSTKSLEELEKFEVNRLTDKVEELANENTTLQTQVERGMIQQIADGKEKELMKKELHLHKEEVNNLKTKLEALEVKHENVLKDIKTSKDEEHNLKEQLKTQQKTFDVLQVSCQDTEKKKNHEKDLLLKELNVEREKQNVASSEMKILKSEIEKLLKEKEEERTFRLKTAERLKQIIEEKNMMEATYKVDLQQITDDFEDLKQHLLHITTDKAEIFKKLSDHLMEKGAKERWVPDKEASSCTNCRETFTLTRRRHHCRICGHIFCFQCADRWLLTPHSSKRVRTCGVCADAYTETHHQGEDRDVIDGPPPQYTELKGDEIEKYEIEGESETEEEEVKK